MSRNIDADYDFSDDIEVDIDEYAEEFGIDEYKSMGIDPHRPTEAKPGSEDKVMMLSARYAAGVPLWHDEDCYDHGPNATADFDEYFEEDEEEEEV
jgi:hypothetical protein